MIVYGVLDNDNCLIDISESLQGCKRYATLNGYTKIGFRNVNSYNAVISHEKINNKWQNIEL